MGDGVGGNRLRLKEEEEHRHQNDPPAGSEQSGKKTRDGTRQQVVENDHVRKLRRITADIVGWVRWKVMIGTGMGRRERCLWVDVVNPRLPFGKIPLLAEVHARPQR